MNQAKQYSESNGFPRAVAEELMREFAPRFRWVGAEQGRELAVLDVGCGPGDVTRDFILPRLPAAVTRVVGVDISEAMVEYATRLHGSVTEPPIHFVQADIEAVDPAEAALRAAAGGSSYDAAFSFFCLHWIQDQRRGLGNIARLLRPGGEGLFVFLGTYSLFSLYEELAEDPRWKQYMGDAKKFISPYQHSPDPAKEFAAVLEDVGFKVNFCEHRQRAHDYHTLENYMNTIKSVNPFIERMPTDDASDYAKELAKKLAKPKMGTIISNSNKQQCIVNYGLLIAHVQRI